MGNKVLKIISIVAICLLSFMLIVPLIALACGLFTCNALVKSALLDIGYALNADGESYAVVSVGNSLKEVEIPAEYKGKPVTRIAEDSFTTQPLMSSGRHGISLDKLVLPSTIESVEDGAFVSGTIKQIYFGGTLADWYGISFGSSPLCSETELYLDGQLLTDFSVPEGVTEIGDNLFYNYSKFDKVIIPEGVTSVGDEAFYGCKNILQATVPKSVVSVGEEAFGDCRRLFEVYNFSPCANWWNEYVLAVHTEEEESYLQWKDDYLIFDNAETFLIIKYRGNGSEIGLPYFSDGNYSICEGLFENNADITYVVIPNGLTEIPENTFYQCANLRTVVLPQSVTEIGVDAFAYCKKLNTINISQTVSYIDNRAFAFIDDLTISYDGTVEQWDSLSKSYRWNFSSKSVTVNCTDGRIVERNDS